MLLVKDLQDLTCGGLFDASEIAADYGFIYGEVVRTGKGFITKEGVIPLATRIGDKIIFLREQSVPFAVFPDFYYLVSEALTSGVLDRDPYPGEIPEYEGIDIDKIFEETRKTYTPSDDSEPDPQGL